jgi:hypothetical protein
MKPYLEKAESSIEGIKPVDIIFMQYEKNPNMITRLIMDTLQILLKAPMSPVEPKIMVFFKNEFTFIKDSYDEHTKNTLQNRRLIHIIK